MDICHSSINAFNETTRIEPGTSVYLPSMYDSDDEDGDTSSPSIDERRDDHIKKFQKEDQLRRGSRYALLRCLAWSQDEDTEETSGNRMNSQSKDDPAVLLTLVGGICTLSSPPALEKTPEKYCLQRSLILWDQQVPSDRDLGTIICGDD